MDNQKLTRLVRLGLKKAGIQDEAATRSVVDCIEVQLEIEAEEREAGEIETPKPAPKAEPVVALPRAMDSIVPAPSAADVEFPFEVEQPISRADAPPVDAGDVPPAELPARPAARPLVTLATDTDMAVEISRSGQTAVAAVPRIRLQSMSGGTRRMDLNATQAAVEAVMPPHLDVIADGREGTIRLFRSTSQLPSSGRVGDKNDMVKVCYLAGGVGKEMETQVMVTVGQAQAGIDATKLIEEIRQKAFAIYRPRPATLEPRKPPMPRSEINVMVEEGTRGHNETLQVVNEEFRQREAERAAREALIAGRR